MENLYDSESDPEVVSPPESQQSNEDCTSSDSYTCTTFAEGNDPDWNSEDLSSDDSTTSDTESKDFMDYITNLRSCAEMPNADTNSTHADSPKETLIQEDLPFEHELVKTVSELKESCTAFSLVAPPDDTIPPSANHIFEAPSVQETPLIFCYVSIAELNTLRLCDI